MWYINEKTKGFSALYKAIKNKSSSEKIVVYHTCKGYFTYVFLPDYPKNTTPADTA